MQAPTIRRDKALRLGATGEMGEMGEMGEGADGYSSVTAVGNAM